MDGLFRLWQTDIGLVTLYFLRYWFFTRAMQGASMKLKFHIFKLLLVVAVSAHCFGQESVSDFQKDMQKAIAAKDYDQAIKLLDESADLPLAVQITSRNNVAAFLMQAKRQDEAMAQFEKACSMAIAAAKEGKITSTNLISTIMLASSATRGVGSKKSAEWVAESLAVIQSKLPADQLTADHRSLIDLLRMKMQMGEPGQAESNKSALMEQIAKCEEIFSKDSSDSAKAAMMLSIWGVQMQMADAEQSDRTYEKATALAQGLIKESANAGVVNSYISLASSYISKNARNAPDAASKALEGAKTFLDGIESDDKNVTQAIEGFLKNAKNIERTIESAKRLLAMIGQPAPEIDPMEWVNGEPLSKLSDLKGRVVLIDFWAVWCGPCIATFPHLKHLDQEYKDKGLTILGVTRQYNMRWDDSKDNYVRGETPVELEEEMGMLEKFIAKHQLTHRTMVTPDKSEMQSQYAVTGIPHAVVIDKQGVVRLVKVGSGSQNAEEIESTIKKLLAE